MESHGYLMFGWSVEGTETENFQIYSCLPEMKHKYTFRLTVLASVHSSRIVDTEFPDDET